MTVELAANPVQRKAAIDVCFWPEADLRQLSGESQPIIAPATGRSSS